MMMMMGDLLVFSCDIPVIMLNDMDHYRCKCEKKIHLTESVPYTRGGYSLAEFV